VLLASIPSPSQGVWHIGSFPIRAYALCIIAGIVAAVIVADRRMVVRGERHGVTTDIAVWAVPFGLVGARLYHLATNPELYWGAHGQGTVAAFKIWDGGLGIWGGVLFGALGAYIGCRRHGVNFAMFADCLAPGLPLAQGIGRWGNYFNQELFGRPTHLPWALRIDPAHRPPSTATVNYAHIALYQPTFLYESLWDVAIAVAVILLDRRYGFSKGRAFALYVALYTLGRFWIESLRIDDAHRFLGLRLNDWTSIIVFVAAVAYFALRRPRPGDGDPDDANGDRSVSVVARDEVPAVD
jgi:prolipoprotein diacylglyceryl transferase